MAIVLTWMCVVVVQLLNLVQLFVTPWTVAHQTPLSSTMSQCLLKFMHLAISSSIAPFSFCLQSFSASGSFPMSQLFASGRQSIGDSASASVLHLNILGWFFLGLTGLISLQSKGLSRVFSSTTLVPSLLYGPALTSIHDCWKNHSFDYLDVCWQNDASAF